jgi:sterol desaturase/sphingolipid hydroxylase (fatty acid hydroxylase superfamily)/CDGSH-type Zn-finger protein
MIDKLILFIADYNMVFVAGILIIFGLLETMAGFLATTKRSKDDVMIEVVNTFFLSVITKPLLVFISMFLMKMIFPAAENMFIRVNFILLLMIFLFIDDFLQYWYHRKAHEIKWLWMLHRPHHTATELGFLASYRESVFYFLLMPNIWWLGIFGYLGGALPMALGIVLKQLIIVSSHSLLPWDKYMYNHKFLKPLALVLERIFITPAFHHAHHAKSIADGIGNPNGNFGNMFSIWDQLFGTAKFSHQFPENYGLPSDKNDSWVAQSFYPLVKSKIADSEISYDFKFELTTKLKPAEIYLEEGVYLFCRCGYSKNQPFCDGMHHGTKIHPLKFTIKKEASYKLCNCKLTEKAPFCDNAHAKK